MLTKRRNSGYTLIEVLVAMVILALSLGVLLRIFSTGLGNISVSADYARAILVAESRLHAAAALSPLAAGVSTGVAEQKYRWTQTISYYDPFTASSTAKTTVEAFTITVDIEWPHADSVRRIRLSSIQLGASKKRL